MKVGDIIRYKKEKEGFRVYRVLAICLGGEGQESVARLECLDKHPSTEGELIVPLDILEAQ